MALNFPTNTSQPYVDPASGLKYIYNTSVGAWESAIQPPAVISDTAPDINIPGFLWWDNESGTLYIWYADAGDGTYGASSQWVEAVPQANPKTTSVSPTAPDEPQEGDFWWNDDNGILYIYYIDPDGGAFWVQTTPGGGGSGAGITGADVSSGVQPPQQPKSNDLWFDSNTGNLYIYYQDADSSQWVATQNSTLAVANTLSAIQVSGPITKTGTASEPILGIKTSSPTEEGVVKLATVDEAKSGTERNAVLTPAVLKEAIDQFLTSGSATKAGILELATTQEVVAGTDASKAVTPASLKAALPGMGVAMPAGTVITFAGMTPPAGYILCDGSEVSRTSFSSLFAAIGTLYGIGDGNTTFKIPDLRGEFIRGYDSGRGLDTGRTMGSTQEGAVEEHKHTYVSGPATNSSSVHVHGAAGYANSAVMNHDTSGAPVGSTETRPRNVALMYCIKY